MDKFKFCLVITQWRKWKARRNSLPPSLSPSPLLLSFLLPSPLKEKQDYCIAQTELTEKMLLFGLPKFLRAQVTIIRCYTMLQRLLYLAMMGAINLWFVFNFCSEFYFHINGIVQKFWIPRVAEFQKRRHTCLEDSYDLIWFWELEIITFYLQSAGYILCRTSNSKLLK